MRYIQAVIVTWLILTGVQVSAAVIQVAPGAVSGSANSCSLIDAINASNTDTAVGACPAGTIGTSHDIQGVVAVPPALLAAITKTLNQSAVHDSDYAIDTTHCDHPVHLSLKACFKSTGAQFKINGSSMTLRLAAWGVPGKLKPFTKRPGHVVNNQITYQDGAIQSWWRVLPVGYEQGFIIHKAPSNHASDIVVDLAVNHATTARTGRLCWATICYGKLFVSDASGNQLTSSLSAIGHTVTLNIDALHARYPIRVDPLIWLEQAINTPDPPANGPAGFGLAVAMSGTTAVITQQYEYQNHVFIPSPAFVYTETNGNWTPVATLHATDVSFSDDFGASVAISGSTIVIGAFSHQVGSNPEQGDAYVFTEPTGGWAGNLDQSAELTASDGSTGAEFGYSVATDGNTVAIGDRFGGEVYVFDQPTGGWSGNLTSTYVLKPNTGDKGCGFGNSVAIVPHYVLVGDPYIDASSACAQGPGEAYVFVLEPNNTWIEETVLSSNDGAPGDLFGASAVLINSGGFAFIGAPGHNKYTGAVYVYTGPPSYNTNWTFVDELSASDGSANTGFGTAMSASGSIAAISSSYSNPGKSYVFTQSTSNTDIWQQTGEFNVASLSIANNDAMVLVGENTNQNSVAYLFSSANLALVLNSQSVVVVNGTYTEQAILTNNDANTSQSLSVLLPVPTGTNYISSTATQGTCTQASSTVTCDFGNLSANGGMASAGVTLQATATASTQLQNSASLAQSFPTLNQTSVTTIAVTPAVTGLKNQTINAGQSSPSENFTIIGTGALTVTAASSNIALLPNSGLSLTPGCTINGANCTLSITPVTGQVGSSTITLIVKDGYGQQASGSFILTVDDVPATANNGSVTTTEGTVVNGTLSATAAYNGQTLTYQLVSQPAHGTAILTNAAGAFTYSPVAGYSGGDSFTFNVKDGANVLSNIATENIIVSAVVNNPIPVISSLNPSNTTAGTAGFTLTVTGTNFVSTSVVDWNGSALTTTYVSATGLTASVPSSDIASAGTDTVTVTNPAPGGGTSGGLSFIVNASSGGGGGTPPSSSGGGGGGAFGLLSLMSLVFALIRRWRWNFVLDD